MSQRQWTIQQLVWFSRTDRSIWWKTIQFTSRFVQSTKVSLICFSISSSVVHTWIVRRKISTNGLFSVQTVNFIRKMIKSSATRLVARSFRRFARWRCSSFLHRQFSNIESSNCRCRFPTTRRSRNFSLLQSKQSVAIAANHRCSIRFHVELRTALLFCCLLLHEQRSHLANKWSHGKLISDDWFNHSFDTLLGWTIDEFESNTMFVDTFNEIHIRPHSNWKFHSMGLRFQQRWFHQEQNDLLNNHRSFGCLSLVVGLCATSRQNRFWKSNSSKSNVEFVERSFVSVEHYSVEEDLRQRQLLLRNRRFHWSSSRSFDWLQGKFFQRST